MALAAPMLPAGTATRASPSVKRHCSPRAKPCPVSRSAPPLPALTARGATPVNASRRTLVLKSYPELKKECEEMTAVRRRRRRRRV